MKRIGICQKCGEEKIVQDHHINGYGEDTVVPYCQSCDQKAHNKAKREGRCELSPDETEKLSHNSYDRRSKKIFILSQKIMEKNIKLMENLIYNINTENITIWSGFVGQHHTKLKIFMEE